MFLPIYADLGCRLSQENANDKAAWAAATDAFWGTFANNFPDADKKPHFVVTGRWACMNFHREGFTVCFDNDGGAAPAAAAAQARNNVRAQRLSRVQTGECRREAENMGYCGIEGQMYGKVSPCHSYACSPQLSPQQPPASAMVTICEMSSRQQCIVALCCPAGHGLQLPVPPIRQEAHHADGGGTRLLMQLPCHERASPHA